MASAYQSWLNNPRSPWRVGWWFLSAVSTVSFVVGYFRTRQNGDGGSHLFIAAVIIIAVLVSEVVRWRIKHRKLEEKLKAMESVPKPVTKRHRKDLQATAKKFADAVRAENDYDFGTRTEKLALRGHFPEVYEQLSQWKAHATLKDVYPIFLRHYIDNDLRHEKVAYPVLKVINFSEYLARTIENRIQQGLKWDGPFDFHWTDLANGDVEIPAYGTLIDAEAAKEAGLTVVGCKDTIQSAFRNQHKWFESELNEIKGNLKEIAPGLETRLDVISTMYEIFGECPSCNQELLNQADDLL